jgi:hypothetical protein
VPKKRSISNKEILSYVLDWYDRGETKANCIAGLESHGVPLKKAVTVVNAYFKELLSSRRSDAYQDDLLAEDQPFPDEFEEELSSSKRSDAHEDDLLAEDPLISGESEEELSREEQDELPEFSDAKTTLVDLRYKKYQLRDDEWGSDEEDYEKSVESDDASQSETGSSSGSAYASASASASASGGYDPDSKDYTDKYDAIEYLLGKMLYSPYHTD